MDNDPKSYRVPIVHLSDVFKKNDQGEHENAGKETANAPVSERSSVREEDIESAVITPKTQPASVSTRVEPTPTETSAVPTPKSLKKAPFIEPPSTETAIPRKEAMKPIEQSLPVEPEALTAEIATDETAAAMPEIVPQEPVPSLQANLETPLAEYDLIPQPKREAAPVQAEQEIMENEEDDDEIQSLINESLLTSVLTEEQGEPKKEPELEPAPAYDLGRDSILPTADPLDIWEQDALRKRHAPIPVRKKLPTVPKLAELPLSENRKPEAATNVVFDTEPMPSAEKRVPVETVTEPDAMHVYETDKDEEIKSVSPLSVGKPPVQETAGMAPDAIPEPQTKVNGGSAGISNLEKLRQRAAGNHGAAVPKSQPVSLADTILIKKVGKDRPKPISEHASAIANVADKLQHLTIQTEISNTSNATGKMDEAVERTPKTLQSEENAVPASIPHVRTFRSDVEQAIMKNRTSMVNMVAAEEKRKGFGETIRRAPRPEQSMFSKVLAWTSFALIAAGICIGGYIAFRVYVASKDGGMPELVPASETVEHNITGQSGTELLEGLATLTDAMQATMSSITVLRIVEEYETEGNPEIRTVEPERFFEKLDSSAPGTLARAANDSMTIGVHFLSENEPFWVFPVNHYEIGFRGMIEWEDSMYEDLAPFFGELPEQNPITAPVLFPTGTEATSTATTTPATPLGPAPELPRYEFEDATIANREARILKNEDGDILLIWAIPDSKTVIITTNPTTFEVLAGRVNTQPYE